GLVSAIRLAAAGRSVAVLERSAQFGGKLAVRERDGFVFDTGPSLLTLPSLLDEVFQLAGTGLAAVSTSSALIRRFGTSGPMRRR
ncbi:MAG: FAD-dependent oxidoreductase, partial [Actinomycetota bacterium]